ncbi:ANKRA2 [Symbiodinium microadriaticum]|nr:ANKRA2 [Symbiodinium microadriaticum]
MPSMTDTPSVRHAGSAEGVRRTRSGLDFREEFPMYTLPLPTFLGLLKLLAHEEMVEAERLTIFDETMGRAMFVSHQWLASHHPDPDNQQLQVLQAALRNLLSGVAQVSQPVQSELFQGRLKCPTAADLTSTPLYIWYDFLCCPQDTSERASRNRQRAIGGIPSYVSKCKYFVVLCPALAHAEQRESLSYETWAGRGWCRAEKMAQDLAARNDSCTIIIESSTHAKLNDDLLRLPPAMGTFTVESDRTRIGHMLVQMIWNKLWYYRERGDLHNYRLLLNEQKSRWFQGLSMDPIDGLVEGFVTDADSFDQPNEFELARFLHQNFLRSPLERDSAGWSPICFAVVRGSSDLVQSLLARRADPNDAITKPKKELAMPRRFSLLSLAAVYHNQDVLLTLLSARADVHARDARNAIAILWACGANDACCIRCLCQARADPSDRCNPGLSALQVASAFAAQDAMAELMSQAPALSLKFCLHHALVVQGGFYEPISFLIQAKADVNEQFEAEGNMWWLVFKLGSFRHKFSPSRLTLISYHHAGATPLMFSILSGHFSVVPLLLAAGARLDVRNSRKQTASARRCSPSAHCLAPEVAAGYYMHPRGTFP